MSANVTVFGPLVREATLSMPCVHHSEHKSSNSRQRCVWEDWRTSCCFSQLTELSYH
jgi:hypothetical protein